MRLTQGCFSFLPDLTDQQIEKQVTYCINKGLAMNVEWTDRKHTSELQSHSDLVCRLLLEKKKK